MNTDRRRWLRPIMLVAVATSAAACDGGSEVSSNPAAWCGGWLWDRYLDPRYADCYDQFESILRGCTPYDDLEPGCQLTNYFDCLTIHSSCIQGVATIDLLACAPVCDPGTPR